MKPTTRLLNDTAMPSVLYMALELSNKQWRVAFGTGQKQRQIVIEAGDRMSLERELSKAKKHFKLREEAEVISCYEAGRDGFWIHRYLEELGIKNHVIDSSSIKVNRKSRHAKTDRLDAEKLLKQLISHMRGEDKLQVARIPSETEEDKRRLHRERDRLKKERTGHTNRIRSLLTLHGIKYKSEKNLELYFSRAKDWKGNPLAEHLKEELLRESKRLDLVQDQLSKLEKEMVIKLKTSEESAFAKIKQLKKLKGIGDVSAWVLIMEWFGWRTFANRREVGAAAGLVGTPNCSGESEREQGISKAGNGRIRSLMIELSWCWLRYQPGSELSKWFDERFNHGKRSRKVGIVALARRLLIAIWRYVTTGEIPKGAELKTC